MRITSRSTGRFFSSWITSRSGGVVFVDEDDNLLAGLRKNTFYQICQTDVSVRIRYTAIIFPLISGQHIVQHSVQSFLIHMLRYAHIKVKHRIPGPLRLQLLNGKTFKQILTTFKIRRAAYWRANSCRNDEGGSKIHT